MRPLLPLAPLAIGLALMAPGGRLAGGSPPPVPRLGINLAGPADWNTELPFVDVFRLSRVWISQRNGAGWGEGPPLDLDTRGWVRRLEPGCFAETPLCTIEGGHYPGGDYTVLYEGAGRIEISPGKVISDSPGRLVVTIDPHRGGFFLRLKQTHPADPVRRIRVLMPGFASASADSPWHPAFLERWRGMAALRFMDWQETNGSRQERWTDRPQPDDATFTRAGIPVELLCDLANRLGSDPWFCLPHAADDDYVREFARLVKSRLDAKRRIYVEYSNEVWNGQFEQHRHAAREGRRLGLADKDWEAAWRYTAHRSLQIFDLWEEIFGGSERLIRVLPSQAANAYVGDQVTGWKDAWKHADALAIAPYLSLNVPLSGKGPNAAEVASWSLDRLFEHLQSVSLPEAVRWMEANRKVAERRNLRLICYEAGQHLVGIQGGENHEALTCQLHAANAHPRMGELYRAYYRSWEDAGGDLLCHFSSVSRWSKWGSWGLLQFHDEDPFQSPKYKATLDWARSRGQAVIAPALRRQNSVSE